MYTIPQKSLFVFSFRAMSKGKSAYNAKVSELDAMTKHEGNNPFAIVMVDINNLKRINDDYGHEAGDLYIKGCCHIICKIFKHSPVFRIGGDEFVVIIQGYDYESRIQNVETLRKAYADSYANAEAEAWERCTAAVGMAESAPEERSFEPVFKRADREMYEDKKKFKKLNGSYR